MSKDDPQGHVQYSRMEYLTWVRPGGIESTYRNNLGVYDVVLGVQI